MMSAPRCMALLALSFTYLRSALAQGETVWSAVIVTLYGDRVPLLSPNYSVMTPLGAQQMFSVGSFIRDRYIAPSNESLNDGNHTIDGISTNEVNPLQVVAITTSSPDVWLDQSAQAFMLGLYPAFNGSSNDESMSSAALANGTSLVSPLDGIQYPQIISPTATDSAYVALSGMENCPNLDASAQNYFTTSDYTSTISSTKDFYQSLSSALKSAMEDTFSLSFTDAYKIWDYLSYGVIHDNNTASIINDTTLNSARYLADSLMWNLYGNLSVDNGIRVVAGRTLANQVVELLSSNIETSGGQSKLTPLFTSFEPMMSLASLLGLTDLFTPFFGMPNLGSSMIFEMYTNTTNATSYPAVADLRIRFMFRNGTTTPNNLVTFPIFGNDMTATDMTLVDFGDGMENIAVGDIAQWCTMCNSEAIFCTGATNGANSLPSGTAPSSPSVSGVTPVVAGVIGAIAALVVAGWILLAAMLLGGVRFRREHTKRRTELGGFKGSEKLAR